MILLKTAYEQGLLLRHGGFIIIIWLIFYNRRLELIFVFRVPLWLNHFFALLEFFFLTKVISIYVVDSRRLLLQHDGQVM